MARNLLAYPSSPYLGAYSSKAFNSNRGQKGLMVGIDLLWPIYTAGSSPLGAAHPNFTVSINLNAAGPNTVAAQWYIQSVYIDNEGVDFPVYVYFLDTFFTVSCPANSAGWYQVFTNGRQALIGAIGITDAAIAAAERTRLFFTDVLMVPSLDQEIQSTLDLWLGSSFIQRSGGLLSGFAPPALGDQIISGAVGMGSVTDVSPISNSAPNNLYLTQIQFSCGLLTNTSGADLLAQLILTNGLPLVGNIIDSRLNVKAGQTLSGILVDVHCNLFFPGDLTWKINTLLVSGAGLQGLVNYQIVYTLH